MFHTPTDYEEVSKVNKQQTKDVLKKYSKYIQFGGKDLILDVGSGVGNVTNELLLPIIPDSDFTLIGVDISKTFVDYANNTVKDPRVTFRVLDITDKNYDSFKSIFPENVLENGFDKIFSFSVISWTKDYEQSLKNIYSLLKPGGQILVWFYGYFTFSDIWNKMIRNHKWLPYLKDEVEFTFPFHYSSDPIGECTDLLKRIGFQNIICDLEKKPQVTNMSENWKHIVKIINPFSHKVPADLHLEYEDDCMKMFYHLIEKTNGLPCERIVIVASRPIAQF